MLMRIPRKRLEIAQLFSGDFLQPNNPPKSQSPIKKSKQGIYFAFTLTQQQKFSKLQRGGKEG
jgi:hypothetical protein